MEKGRLRPARAVGVTQHVGNLTARNQLVFVIRPQKRRTLTCDDSTAAICVNKTKTGVGSGERFPPLGASDRVRDARERRRPPCLLWRLQALDLHSAGGTVRFVRFPAEFPLLTDGAKLANPQHLISGSCGPIRSLSLSTRARPFAFLVAARRLAAFLGEE